MPGRLPPLPPAPGSAYPTILPSDEPAEAGRSRGHRSDRADETPADERPDRSKLLPLLLALAVILGGGYLLVSQLTGGDDTDNTPVPRASRPVASASAAPSAPARTYTAAQIAQALQDPHFKHGYDAGKAKAAAGAVSDPEATCREMGLAERTKGYPWGAHDRQGCLVGLTG